MLCPNCSREVPDQLKLCEWCGIELPKPKETVWTHHEPVNRMPTFFSQSPGIKPGIPIQLAQTPNDITKESLDNKERERWGVYSVPIQSDIYKYISIGELLEYQGLPRMDMVIDNRLISPLGTKIGPSPSLVMKRELIEDDNQPRFTHDLEPPHCSIKETVVPRCSPLPCFTLLTKTLIESLNRKLNEIDERSFAVYTLD